MQETKALISAMTGEARGGSRAAAPGCGFSRGRTGRSVSLSWGATEVESPCEWREEHLGPYLEDELEENETEQGSAYRTASLWKG